MNISREAPSSPAKKQRGRWRSRNETVDNKRKRRRNSGYDYKSRNGRSVEQRSLGPACGCPKRCREKVGPTNAAILFNNFWDLGAKYPQDQYLMSCLDVKEKARSYPKKRRRLNQTCRRFSVIYNVLNGDSRLSVCKKEFLSIHGLKKKRIDLLVKQLEVGSTTAKKDGRGLHPNHHVTYSVEQRNSVKDHIAAIPKYTSHYSRQQNPSRTYLNCDLSIKSLWRDHYRPWCEERSIDPVSEDFYRRTFCSDFNIGFKLPKSDTCSTCDRLKIQIDHEEDDDEKRRLISNLELHHSKAKAFQDYLKEQGERARSGDISVLAFDLQQALPTPKLTCGPAFYKRKIWTLNEGVHDLGSETGFMYLWSEDEGNRGADEVASILLQHIQNNDMKEDLVVFSDNCKGQNKNWTIMSLWYNLVKEKRFKSITHVFLITGHTHLPCDRDFGHIEKLSRRKEHVYCPQEWAAMISSVSKFRVQMLTVQDFRKISNLPIKRATKTVDGRKLEFSNAQVFRFDDEHPGKMLLKASLNGLFHEAVIEPTSRGLRTRISNLPCKHTEKLRVKESKLRDVLSLLPFIPPIFHGFYYGLKGDVAADIIGEYIEEMEDGDD